MKLKAPKHPKLKPIKYTSAIIDHQKNKKKFKTEKKRIDIVKRKGSKKTRKEEVDEEMNQPLFYKIEASVELSKESKRRRYSNSNLGNNSLSDSNFKLIGESDESPPSDTKEVGKLTSMEEKKNFKDYIPRKNEGKNERKISIMEVNSPERNLKKLPNESEDHRPYQASTYYSNTMNKSSKKSGFKFSSDFDFFGDDEVNHEKSNKNREIIGILSENDFEKFSTTIEKEYQKNIKESNKFSQKQPFSS